MLSRVAGETWLNDRPAKLLILEAVLNPRPAMVQIIFFIVVPCARFYVFV